MSTLFKINRTYIRINNSFINRKHISRIFIEDGDFFRSTPWSIIIFHSSNNVSYFSFKTEDEQNKIINKITNFNHVKNKLK